MPWRLTAYRSVIALFVTDTMQSPVNLILVACVCVVVSMAMPCWSDPLPASGEIASRPTRPKVFNSPDQLKDYLQNLVNYYTIEGRPRCVRRESFDEVDRRGFWRWCTVMWLANSGEVLQCLTWNKNAPKDTGLSHTSTKYTELSHTSTKYIELKSHLNKVHRTKSHFNKVHRTKVTPQQSTQN